jgi:molybdenum cofactor cytidylyltransferase
MTDIAAIILAAGRSTRFAARPDDATKLVGELCGKPLVRHAAEAALHSFARPVVVVTGHQRAAVEAALTGLDLTLAFNPDYAAGLSASLKRGVATLPATCAGAVILLGDMPLVSDALIDRLIGAYAQGCVAAPQTPLAAAPVRAGRRGNPVLIGRALFPAIAALDGDQGARCLLDRVIHRIVLCAVEDDSALIDVDTQAALRQLQSG